MDYKRGVAAFGRRPPFVVSYSAGAATDAVAGVAAWFSAWVAPGAAAGIGAGATVEVAIRLGLRPTFGPADLARLPGLLCLGSAELVLPCSLPCFFLPWRPASLIEAALRAASTKGVGP